MSVVSSISMSDLPGDDTEACIDTQRMDSLAVSEAVEERVNGRPARLDEAARAVHVARRCGTDRRPACHVPLPARQGYHLSITVNYDRRQAAEPQVASVAALIDGPVGSKGVDET